MWNWRKIAAWFVQVGVPILIIGTYKIMGLWQGYFMQKAMEQPFEWGMFFNILFMYIAQGIYWGVLYSIIPLVWMWIRGVKFTLFHKVIYWLIFGTFAVLYMYTLVSAIRAGLGVRQWLMFVNHDIFSIGNVFVGSLAAFAPYGIFLPKIARRVSARISIDLSWLFLICWVGFFMASQTSLYRWIAMPGLWLVHSLIVYLGMYVILYAIARWQKK